MKSGQTERAQSELLLAIGVYRLAATTITVAEVASHVWFHVWTCLGLALKRAGQLDMAQRAYLWASLDKVLNSIFTNFTCLLQARHDTKAASLQLNLKSVREQCKQTAKSTKGFKFFSSKCENPACKNVDGGKLRKCANCKVALYCSTECQKKHWQEHKPVCKKNKEAGEKVSSSFSQNGPQISISDGTVILHQ